LPTIHISATLALELSPAQRRHLDEGLIVLPEDHHVLVSRSEGRDECWSIKIWSAGFVKSIAVPDGVDGRALARLIRSTLKLPSRRSAAPTGIATVSRLAQERAAEVRTRASEASARLMLVTERMRSLSRSPVRSSMPSWS